MLTFLSVAVAASVDVSGGVVAERGASRHHLAPSLSVGASAPLHGLLMVRGELQGTGRKVVADAYSHSTLTGRVSVGIGISKQNKRVGVDVWAGPAVVLHSVQIDAHGLVFPEAGLRAASGLNWYLTKSFYIRPQVGTMLRISRTLVADVDCVLGVGVRW